MLYIRQYDKFNLDKSSINQYNYYRTKFNDLSIDIDALLAELQSLLDTIQVLRQQLNDNKDMLYDILNDTKSVFAQAKVSADSAFDYIENLLDNAEQALDSLEENINITIQEILDDCSQVVDCSEVDCAEGVNSSDEEDIIINEEGGDEGCGNCSFSYNDPSCDNSVNTGATYDPECGQWTDEFGNTYTGTQPEDGCTYSYTVTDTGDEWFMDGSCNEYTCNYSGSGISDGGPDDCNFSCNHSSGCSEQSMPVNCSYTCDDGGCVYDGGADCTYSSNGNDVDDECGEEIIECTLYGDECFETECGEACGNCGQDCSEDCGDCGDSWCGEDDTGCSEDDCCVYSGGSQSEGDDDCGEDCGDCCVYG